MLRGVRLAPAAAQWLAGTTAARVLNVFDRACNLINAEGAVLALVTSERGLTPFGLVVENAEPAPFRGLPADSPVRLAPAAQVLAVGRVQVQYGGAALWEARPNWGALRAAFANSAAPLARLAALAEAVTLEGSLLDLYRPGQPATPTAQALRLKAGLGTEKLVAGLAARDAAEASAGARALAGLGGGLTPAGDDFVVGVLLAAWAGLYGAGAETLAPAVAEAAAAQTTTLSAAYLRAAARGECIAHWHALCEALLRADGAALQAAVAALVSIGHTSGADALAGFLAVHYVLGRGSAPARPAGG